MVIENTSNTNRENDAAHYIWKYAYEQQTPFSCALFLLEETPKGRKFELNFHIHHEMTFAFSSYNPTWYFNICPFYYLTGVRTSKKKSKKPIHFCQLWSVLMWKEYIEVSDGISPLSSTHARLLSQICRDTLSQMMLLKMWPLGIS